MKKIINGKLYSTETAREVGAWSNAGNWRDFSHMEETLYCKRTGEYFLFGEGGPMTQYAEACGNNSWTGGQRIMPMTAKEAREWAEEKLTADEYEEEFGDVAEGDETRVSLTISLTAAEADRIRKEAREQGVTISALIASKFQGGIEMKNGIDYRKIVKASLDNFQMEDGTEWIIEDSKGGKKKVKGSNASGIWNSMTDGSVCIIVNKADVMKVNPDAAIAIFNGGAWERKK